MFLLAGGKARSGRALQNPELQTELQTEGQMTAIVGVLAVAVLARLVLNNALGCLRLGVLGDPPPR
jgi:hypothetical protein